MARSEKPSAQDIALIVGGSPGIGTSCARLFAAQRMHVGIAARAPDKHVLETLEKDHGVRRYGCDASDPVDATAAIRVFVQRRNPAVRRNAVNTA